MGDEAFRQLSAFDPSGNELLDKVLSPLLIIQLQRGCTWFIYNVCACYNYDLFLSQAMAADKSDEWFAKHKKQKASA